MADVSTSSWVHARLLLDNDIVMGVGPGCAVFGHDVRATLSAGSKVPSVRAFGYRINLDGEPGRLWQHMDVPWESLPANIRHRLARLLREEQRRLVS